MAILSSLFLLTVGLALAQHPGLEASPDCAVPCLNDTMPQLPCVPGQEPCPCYDALFAPGMLSCIGEQCSVADSLRTFNASSLVCDLPIVDRGRIVSVSGVAFGIIDATLIALRFTSRPRGYIGWRDNVDDWVMIINGIFVLTMAVLGFELAQYGYGRDIWTLSFDQMTAINKLLYCHELMWSLILTFTRISILFFYRRVIPLDIVPKLKLAIDGSIVWTICGGLIISLPLIFRCTPFEPQFYSFQEGPAGLNCIDMQKHAWATGAINFTSDIWLVLLPIPTLGRLKLKLRKKIGVGLMFCFGGFVTLASIPRMVSLMQYTTTINPTYDWVYVSFWSATEAYVGVMCACMPRTYMLISRLYRHFFPAQIDSRPPTTPHLTEVTNSTVSSSRGAYSDLLRKESH
ncbi:hypothetical protein GQ53DRAFT_814783 [Thozetella sp. PMI_491]|nr:hypothetical protein GQ53DRAFT_814783 [Thozetella sp. PMI_491]